MGALFRKPKTPDIKVNAPSSNPHICYIPREMERKVKYAKDKTGLSLYRILSESAGFSLSKKENIHRFKDQLKEFGYKNVSYDREIVYYTELDGTEHRLLEDIRDENGNWIGGNYNGQR